MRNEALRKRYRTSRRRCGTLRDVMECYGSVTELLRNLPEPLRKISFSRFDTILACDGRTYGQDGRTDGHTTTA